MKFDCVKVSGKVDYVRSVDRMNGGHKAKVSIDGAVIPNLQVSNKLYEELEVGESVTLYGLFKRNKAVAGAECNTVIELKLEHH
ncbi:hypothetical protein ACW9IW_32325, partial [Pseudomonas azotoformans]